MRVLGSSIKNEVRRKLDDMKTMEIILWSLGIFFFLVFLGIYLIQRNKIRYYIKLRDNADLTTLEGRVLKDMCNAEINRIYGIG